MSTTEPLALKWSDVDLPRSEALVYRRKTGDHDFIELSERLSAVLRPLEPDLEVRGDTSGADPVDRGSGVDRDRQPVRPRAV